MSPQQTIAHYRITAKLGEGGMGEVWRATDTKLGREVAIKIIPEAFAQDADRMARFTREAQVLASLNHPNIAAIYGVEERALVMELVEGPTLAERIAHGPVPLEEALPMARQIAEALEYAHEKGIVHRDLKPANVKVTHEGRVKVLDFGLAKALSNDAPATDPELSPTVTMRATQAGVIMGTAAYMSPEQAKGKPVDRRADTWSFGVVLAEMLTGRHLYPGATVPETLASVIRDEPDLDSLPANTPPAIRNLVRRCLNKDPLHRLQAIGDARIAIEEALAGAPAEDAAPAAAAHRNRMLPWAIAGASTLALIVTGVLFWRATRPVAHPLMRFSVDLGAEAQLSGAVRSSVILSPDGARMAFVSRGANGISQISTRPLDQAKAKALAGTENVEDLFFSPDGQWIGFFADRKLKKIYVESGAAVTVCDAPEGRGGTWGEDGYIIAALHSVGPLGRVSAAGGTPPQDLTQLDAQKGEQTHRYPQILPGGKAVLFTAGIRGAFNEAALEVQSLQTGQRKTLLRGGFFGRYLPNGHLVYMRQDILYAAPMDLEKLELTGPSVPVLEEVATFPLFGTAQFDFSRTGTFVYVSGTAAAVGSIAWLDSTGKTRPLLGTPGAYLNLSFAPDGKRLATSVGGGLGRSNLAVYDWQRDTTSRLGSTSGPDIWPVWTPDGKGIVYQSPSASGFGLYWVRSDGASTSVQLTETKDPKTPRSLSPDGKRLAYSESGSETQDDLWTVLIDWSDPEHPKAGKPEVFLRTPAAERDPVFSPDGRWIAYGSNNGPKPEVYVRPFPPNPTGGQWQVSNGGGRLPVWSPNGRELFYEAEDQIMVVSYTVKGAGFIADKPRLWSGHRISRFGGPVNYDLAPDGKRFAILESTEASEAKPATHANVLLNFFDELRRRTQGVPPGGK